jgi:hypothetical protein
MNAYVRKGLEEEFIPGSLMERELVERLAGIIWGIRRRPKFEAALMRLTAIRCGVLPTPPKAETFEGAGGATGVALMADSHQDALANCPGTEQR